MSSGAAASWPATLRKRASFCRCCFSDLRRILVWSEPLSSPSTLPRSLSPPSTFQRSAPSTTVSKSRSGSVRISCPGGVANAS
eukprot:COSAG01_NODE_12441_length_1739_cov_1.050000_2_plen_83_part_00